MAKSNVKKWIPGGIALLFGLIAFFMLFVDAVMMDMKEASGGLVNGTEGIATGWEFAFGTKEGMQFNIMIFLAFFLPLIGGVLSFITGNGFLMKIITTACFVVGAVFLFCTLAFVPIGIDDDMAKKAWELAVENDINKLGAGPIVAGVFSILGAVVCFFKGTIAKKIG